MRVHLEEEWEVAAPAPGGVARDEGVGAAAAPIVVLHGAAQAHEPRERSRPPRPRPSPPRPSDAGAGEEVADDAIAVAGDSGSVGFGAVGASDWPTGVPALPFLHGTPPLGPVLRGFRGATLGGERMCFLCGVKPEPWWRLESEPKKRLVDDMVQ